MYVCLQLYLVCVARVVVNCMLSVSPVCVAFIYVLSRWMCVSVHAYVCVLICHCYLCVCAIPYFLFVLHKLQRLITRNRIKSETRRQQLR